MHTHLHKDRTMGECIVDSQEKVGHVDNEETSTRV